MVNDVTTLSRIWLNPLRPGGQKLLGNPQVVHAAVLGGFPALAPDERVLWRLEKGDPHCPELLVLGPGVPDWSHVVEQAGWPASTAKQVRTADYAPLLSRVVDGREFAFRLTANPVQNVGAPDGAAGRGTRVGHRTERHQLGWFLERAGHWGFEVVTAPPAAPSAPGLRVADSAGASDQGWPDARVVGRERLSFSKGGGQRVTLSIATFEGRLRTLDAGVLRAALVRGLGPAKAYGCGLLTLAPTRH